MRRDGTEASIRRRSHQLLPTLDERQRRLWAAAEASALGYGGVSLVARATGVSRRAIHAGLAELAAATPGPLPAGRVRRPGAGPKPLTQLQPGLLAALEALVEPTCRGEPASPLRWTCKGVRRLAGELRQQGFRVGRQKVAELLHELGYSLQANRKTREGNSHADRDAPFRHISRRVQD
jgi:Rhodopirellula transposase DDE domain